ncbi:MAG: ROK family protein [Rhodobacteraceae bacterium]|nr:ROK family protein [Paracoccaceae bacterium]
MIAGGIDVGGTKIEASLFDGDWQAVETRRVKTPASYDELVAAVQDQAAWLEAQHAGLPLGIGIPGRHDSKSGLAFTANLPASQKPLRADILKAIGRDASFGNDCDLFAFSEATLGAGRGFHAVFGLILGTGIGGGFCIGQKLFQSANGTVGEVGHLPFSANLNLPLHPCGCGRTGCFETLGAGPGMVALNQHITGHTASPAEIAAKDGEGFKSWLNLIAALVASLQCTLDPDCIVLGGGLSNIEGVAERISEAAVPVMLKGTAPPVILKAKFGDSSGTRGAALLAVQRGTT